MVSRPMTTSMPVSRLALREPRPGMAKNFRHYAHQSQLKPGELWTYRSADGHTIYNLMTQEGDHA